MTGQTRVDEVELRRLDETLPEVLVERRHQQDLARDLEDRQPLRDRRHRDTERRCEIAAVQHLATATGDQRHESPKRRQVPNRCDRPNVAFEVGLDVGTKPGSGGSGALDNLGEPSAKERNPGAFRQRERQQVKERHPPGHRLGDPSHERRLLRAGQQPLPLELWSTVDPGADVGQQLRRILYLVENDGSPQIVEEAARILPDTRDNVGVLEQKVAGVRKEMLEERRLAGSAGAGDEHRREGPCRPTNLVLDAAAHVSHVSILS